MGLNRMVFARIPSKSSTTNDPVNDQSRLSTSATIIIAAYNESSVIRQTLARLEENNLLDQYQILVVCNGCTDNTEEIVRNEFSNVHCHSIPNASKALAIRHAESLNPGFPRLYLDADIILSAEGAASLIALIRDQESAALLIPSSKILTSSSSTAVQRFYRYWYSTRHVQDSGYGAGTYLLNQQGRARFGRWPDLVADDAFIRSQFSFDEIRLEKSINVDVKAPKNLCSLIKVKTRSKFGNIELKAYLENGQTENRNHKTNKDPRPLLSTGDSANGCDRIAYILVNLVALGMAKWQLVNGKKKWLRDNSNR
jgi:glycosyltransferase involved in cell wall biosynthesis